MIKPLNSILQQQVLMKVYPTSDEPDYTAFVGTVDSFVQVSWKKLFDDTIEVSLLKKKRNEYREKALELLKALDFSGYVSQVTRMLADEQVQCHAWIDNTSFMKVRRVFHQRMLADHFPFIQEGCKDALKNGRWDDLTTVYNLLKPFEKRTFAQEFEQHVKEILLSELANQRESAITIIAEFHKKYLAIIQHTFQGDVHFYTAMDQGCAHAVTTRHVLVMKSMQKGLKDTDNLEQVLLVFSFIHEDKDILSRLYSKALAKRLLKGTSCSVDVERSVVRMLAEYGYQTKRMDMMFQDICKSQDLTVKFRTSHHHNDTCLDNFSVYLLNPFTWPFQHTSASKFSIPLEVEQQIKLFESFYQESYEDKKLTWHPEASRAEIELTYTHRPYVVIIESFFVSTVLLRFEDHDNLSFEEIAACIHLPEEELLQHLQTLVDAKLLLLDHAGEVHKKSTLISTWCSPTNTKLLGWHLHQGGKQMQVLH